MAHAHSSAGIAQVSAPPLAPRNLVEILREADALLALIGNRPLDTVAELADTLTRSANEAGADEVAQAASTVSHIASGRQAVVLAGAIRDLTAAIARARHAYHVES